MTDLGPVLSAQSPQQLLAAATAGWLQVQATAFPRRAEALAEKVQEAEPDLIGLQEVFLWRTDVPSDGPLTPATQVAYDFLEILLAELAERALHYAPVAVVTNFEAEVPTALGFGVRGTDRDVILARTDLEPARLAVSNPMAARFTNNLMIQNPVSGTRRSTRLVPRRSSGSIPTSGSPGRPGSSCGPPTTPG